MTLETTGPMLRLGTLAIASLLCATPVAAQNASPGARAYARGQHGPGALAILTEAPFGTLRGISIGALYTLRHPKTNAWTRARVLNAGTHPKSGIQAALLQFSDGCQMFVAADRLHLTRASFGTRRRYLAALKLRTALAIEEEYQQPATQTPISTHNPKPLRDKLGEGVDVDGFFRGYRAHVSRPYYAFDRVSMAHEVLHTLSVGFRGGIRNEPLNEALTEYFSNQVAIRRLGRLRATDEKAGAYYHYYRLGLRLAEIVGDSALKKLYFSADGSSVKHALRGAVDAKRGAGAFDRAMDSLGRGRFDEIFDALGGPPRSLNPWVGTTSPP